MATNVWEVLANRLSLAKRLRSERVIYVHGKVDGALCRGLAAMINAAHGGQHEANYEPSEDGYRLTLVDRQGVAREFRDAAIAMGTDPVEAERTFCGR